MGTRLAFSIVLLTLLGCSHLKGPFDPVEGRNFAAEKLSQIEEGTPAEEVLQLLGEPIERDPGVQGERWRYFVREERVDEVRFLGLLPVQRTRWARTTETQLVVRDGRVTEVFYDSEVIPLEQRVHDAGARRTKLVLTPSR